MKVYRQWVPCKGNSLYNFNPFFMQLCTSFFHGLKICMWFGFNPAVNFCHFSTLLTLSFFNFSQVRHQLHRSSIYIYVPFGVPLITDSVASNTSFWIQRYDNLDANISKTVSIHLSLGPYVGNFCGKPHSNVWLTTGLACGIFHRLANILKTDTFSDFCVRNQ